MSEIIKSASQKWDGADFKIKLEQVGRMSATDYLQQRKGLAKDLRIPCGLLDEERKRQQKEGPTDSAVMQAHWTVEPWPEPVHAATLFKRIKARLRQHVFMNDHSATAAALWAMFAWVHDAAVHSPILLVSSPEAECGRPPC
jgi:hypothetical protein